MSKPLRVLIIDDSVYDCMLLVKELRRGGLEPRYARVDTASALCDSLTREPWDLVLADWTVPDFPGPAVLKLVREQQPELPVIVVSETPGDEAAVAAMTAGAKDYVLKVNLARLVPAVERELRELEDRRARKKAEQQRRRTEEHFRLLVESTSDVISVLSVDGTLRYESPSVERVLGYRPDELSGVNVSTLVHPDDLSAFHSMLAEVARDPASTRSAELRFRHKDGSWRTLECQGRNLLDHPSVAGIVVTSHDVTERRQAAIAVAAAPTVQRTPPPGVEATHGEERATKSELRPRHAADSTEWIGRYRVLGRLGAGGMGTVFKAHDPKLDRLVAVKVPRFDLAHGDVAVLIQRFLREARAAAQIRHPNVCPIYDVDEQDGLPFVVMAYVEGQSLAERLRATPQYADPAEAVRLVRQVATGLRAVHAHGIVHRDLKPANILLDRDNQALLTDFGLARPEHDAQRLTLHGAVLGTPGYMAPEQAAGESDRIGPWTDLYSLGVVLYCALTGRLPFEGSAITMLLKLLSEPPPAPRTLRPDLDASLETIVLKAIARRPEDRYQCAQSLIDAVDGWLSAHRSSSAADGPPSGVFFGEL